MTKAEIQAVTPEQILGEFHLEVLSPNAIKLYTGVWLVMRERNSTETWIPDDTVSRKSRLLLKYVPAAQSELARAGLLEMVPGDGQTRYQYVDIADESEQHNRH